MTQLTEEGDGSDTRLTVSPAVRTRSVSAPLHPLTRVQTPCLSLRGCTAVAQARVLLKNDKYPNMKPSQVYYAFSLKPQVGEAPRSASNCTLQMQHHWCVYDELGEDQKAFPIKQPDCKFLSFS